MKPLIDPSSAMKDTMDAYNAVRRCYKTEQYQDVVNWIECLIAQCQIHMTSCAAVKLNDVQVRLKQLLALRSALVDPCGATTGYSFD